MARFDKDGNPIPVMKPEKSSRSKPKSGSRAAQPTEVVGTNPPPAGKIDRKAQNTINRNFGKSVEREVAKLTGGTRVPMSGAVKNSVHNLEGDVSVRSRDGKKVLALIECKGTSGINPKGEKIFNLKFSVLEQAKKEAQLQKALPLVWIHPKGEKYENDWIIIPSELGLEVLEILKDRYDLEVSLKENDDDYNQRQGRGSNRSTD